MADNPFDQFDPPRNPFDRFDPQPRKHEAEIQRRKKILDERDPYDFMDNLIEQGLFLGGADEIAGVAGGIGGAIRGLWDPEEGFSKGYEVAAEVARDRQKEYAARYPGRSLASSALGVVIPGFGAAKGGLTAYRAGQTGIPAAMRAGAIDAAATGAATGFLGGEGVEGRLTGAAGGGLLGGAIGGAVPPIVSLGKATVGALGGNALVGAIDPTGYARGLLARTMQESGQTPREIRKGIRSAELDAQGDVWTLADQLGYSGRRRLAGATQSPSQAREEAQTFLRDRQAGQGERITASLEDNFGTGQTAEEARRALIDARDDTAGLLYGEARRQAQDVDLSTVINRLDQELNLTPAQAVATRSKKGQAPTRQRIDESKLPVDSIARALARVRNSLTDVRNGVTLKDWGLIYRARQDLADLIGRSGLRPEGGYNNQGRILAQVRGQIDEALETASAPYRIAAMRYRADAKKVEAVELGEQAAQGTGKFARSGDNIKAYKSLSPEEQEAFRAGYVSQLLTRVERKPGLQNQAENFTSMKLQAELKAFAAPGRGQRLPRTLERERTMHDTRREAFLGSQTSRNLADEADVSSQLSMIANLLRTDWKGAGQSAYNWASSKSSGYTEQVRNEVVRMLMQTPAKRGNKAAFDRFMKSLSERQARDLQREQLRALLLRGGYAGAGVNAPSR